MTYIANKAYKTKVDQITFAGTIHANIFNAKV